jgi:hypothetical protein
MTPAPLITETLKAPTLMSLKHRWLSVTGALKHWKHRHWCHRNTDDSASLKHRKTGSTDTDATEAPTMDISPITETLMHSVMVMMPATLAPLTYDSVKHWCILAAILSKYSSLVSSVFMIYRFS